MQNLLGKELYSLITACVPISQLTEIRLRLGCKISIKKGVKNIFLEKIADSILIEKVLMIATKFSPYAFQEELINGYYTYNGGIRIGVVGQGVISNNNIIAFKNISSLNIRIPHQIMGIADKLSNITSNFKNTLIISPPFCGKTTLIREMTRVLSNSYDVLVIDERYEIVAMQNNIKTFDMGDRLDVISGAPKKLAYVGGIRSISPEIIVMDEIFPDTDLDMIKDINRCGVKILSSIHSDDYHSISSYSNKLLSNFKYLITLSSNPSIGSIKSIIRLGDD